MTIWNPRTGKRAAKSRKAHRHFKPDRLKSRDLFLHGYFVDAGSFVSLNDHELREGEDKSRRRHEIFVLYGGKCFNCGVVTTEGAGEWDHIKNKPGERCDCVHNGRWACKPCHRKRHVHPQFSGNGAKA